MRGIRTAIRAWLGIVDLPDPVSASPQSTSNATIEPANFEAVASFRVDLMADQSCILFCQGEGVLDTGDPGAIATQLAFALNGRVRQMRSESEPDARLRQGSAPFWTR